MERCKASTPATSPAACDTYVLTESLLRVLAAWSARAWAGELNRTGRDAERAEALELLHQAQRELVMLQMTDVHARLLVAELRELKDRSGGECVELLERLVGRHFGHLKLAPREIVLGQLSRLRQQFDGPASAALEGRAVLEKADHANGGDGSVVDGAEGVGSQAHPARAAGELQPPERPERLLDSKQHVRFHEDLREKKRGPEAGAAAPGAPDRTAVRRGLATGGERGIRTPDALPGTPDFESARPFSERNISLAALEYDLVHAAKVQG